MALLLVLSVITSNGQGYVNVDGGYGTHGYTTFKVELGGDLSIASLYLGGTRNTTSRVDVPEYLYSKAGIRAPIPNTKFEASAYYLFGMEYERYEVSQGTDPQYSHMKFISRHFHGYAAELIHKTWDKAHLYVSVSNMGRTHFYSFGYKMQFTK